MSRLVMPRIARQVPEFLLVSSDRSVGKYLIAYGASGQHATVRVKGYRSRISTSSSGINTGLAPVTTENGRSPIAFGFPAHHLRRAGCQWQGPARGRGGREGARALAVCGPA